MCSPDGRLQLASCYILMTANDSCLFTFIRGRPLPSISGSAIVRRTQYTEGWQVSTASFQGGPWSRKIDIKEYLYNSLKLYELDGMQNVKRVPVFVIICRVHVSLTGYPPFFLKEMDLSHRWLICPRMQHSDITPISIGCQFWCCEEKQDFLSQMS